MNCQISLSSPPPILPHAARALPGARDFVLVATAALAHSREAEVEHAPLHIDAGDLHFDAIAEAEAALRPPAFEGVTGLVEPVIVIAKKP
jgi:hypothetical protein